MRVQARIEQSKGRHARGDGRERRRPRSGSLGPRRVRAASCSRARRRRRPRLSPTSRRPPLALPFGRAASARPERGPPESPPAAPPRLQNLHNTTENL